MENLTASCSRLGPWPPATTEPTHSSPAFHVVGLNSARPFRHQGGTLRDDTVVLSVQRFQESAEG